MDEQTLTEKPRRIRKFVSRHKVAITVFATSACWIAMNRAALKQHNDFLKERGLYEEFYTPEETEEV